MRLIDEQYLKTPFYGSRKMTAWLKTEGEDINRKRVQRLMRTMGLEALYAKPKTTERCPEHRVFPYLLRGLVIDRPDQVWATDITYIPMAIGFLYLVAILDWFSRCVLSWRLSNSLEASFCVEALEQALTRGKPEIFNSDQGCQFTSQPFVDTLLQAGVQVSMDGKGRCMDNVFTERLWRSLKHEEIYLHAYESGVEAHAGIGSWIRFYNEERFHQSLNYQTPRSVYERACRSKFPIVEPIMIGKSILSCSPQPSPMQAA
jgi:putative transposase